MRGTRNEDAWKAYLDGERLFSVVSRQQMELSRERFELATRLDCKFARAWGWLAYVIARSVVAGWSDPGQLREAEGYARKAVELDYSDYATHWDLAFAFLYQRKFDKAKREFEIALNLYNNDTDLLDRKPGLLAEMGEALIHMGEIEEGRALIRKAMRVPSWYRWNLAWGHYNEACQKRKDGDDAGARAAYEACAQEMKDVISEGRGVISGMHLLLVVAQSQLDGGAALATSRGGYLAQKEQEDGPDYSSDTIKDRWVFKDEACSDHWIEGLEKAGLL